MPSPLSLPPSHTHPAPPPPRQVTEQCSPVSLSFTHTHTPPRQVTELCNLLTYRMLPQKERDAAFLRDFTDGYVYLDDEDFIEVGPI